MRPLFAAALLIASLPVLAKDRPVLKYSPPADSLEERPVATELVILPQGNDFAMRVEFNKAPWGDDCKNRCANATFFLDTDSSVATGLQLGKGVPETGADLAVTIQGSKVYKESSAASVLRVKVKQLGSNAKSLEDGESLAEMDQKADPDRVQAEGNAVFALVDVTSVTIPSAKKMRVVYHPVGSKALSASTAGILASTNRKLRRQ